MSIVERKVAEKVLKRVSSSIFGEKHGYTARSFADPDIQSLMFYLNSIGITSQTHPLMFERFEYALKASEVHGVSELSEEARVNIANARDFGTETDDIRRYRQLFHVFNIIRPLEGSKIVIEGRYQKSGKTLLAVAMLVAYLDLADGSAGFGNIAVDHVNYSKIPNRGQLTKKMLAKARNNVVVIDELDTKYPWQDAYWNKGLLSFWGEGASHHGATVIVTIQNDFGEIKKKLKRNFHFFCEGVEKKDGKPVAVYGHVLKPVNTPFYQTIRPDILERYDAWEKDTGRLEFDEFIISLQDTDANNQQPGTVETMRCTNCGYKWKPRKKNPKSCPNCHIRFGKNWQ